MRLKKKDYVKMLKNCKLIIGNGFDLFCGLKSSYKDFFNNQRNQYDMLINDCNKYINSEEYKKFFNYNDISHYKFKPIFSFDCDFNVWDCFFALYFKRYEEMYWCDIEELLKESLTSDKVHAKDFSWKHVYSIMQNGSFHLRNANHNEIMCASFIKTKYNIEEIRDVNGFYSLLLKELKKIEVRFGFFLIKQISNYNYINKALNFIGNISQNIISIDSFNYTNFTNKLHYGEIYRNINGDLEGVLKNESSLIFGIDSTNIEPDSPEYIFTKVYRRMELSIINTKVHDFKLFENIIIFGHSLNEQDYNYFFPLFDYLNLNDATKKNSIVVLYSIYNEDKKQSIIDKILKNTCKMLSAYDKYANNRIENRLMEMLIAENRLVFIEIKNDE